MSTGVSPTGPNGYVKSEAVADAREVPFGMLYLGSGFERRNDRWLDQMAQHAATLEQGTGVTPDIVGFYSWHSLPDRLLPDDDIDAYTGRINQYFGARTQLEMSPTRGQGRRRSLVHRRWRTAGRPDRGGHR